MRAEKPYKESKKDSSKSDELVPLNAQNFAEDDLSEAAAAIIDLHDAEFKKLVKFDEVSSIYSLVESIPNKFKEFLDDLTAQPDKPKKTPKNDKIIFKTVFCYFFELIGVQNPENLKNIVEKTQIIEKEQDWDKFLKENKPEDMINFEKLQLLSTEKDGNTHKKFLKRFFKILVTNLIDMYPKRHKLLELIIDKICILAQSKVRLIRFGFTVFALSLTKVLLHQFNDISQVMSRIRSQPTLNREQDSMITDCHALIKNQLLILSAEVIHERANDPQEFIRKQVLETIS
jgi:hypothetical protein